MQLVGIYTIRDVPQSYYWDVVFEWEDELSRALNIPLVMVGERYERIYRASLSRKLLNRLDFNRVFDRLFYRPQKFYLAFHIGPPGVYSFYTRADVVPIIIDFWKTEPLDRFARIFSNSKVVFITSNEAYKYLLGKSIPLPLEHLPLSVPDKFLVQQAADDRKFDIVQFGRQNSKLTAFVRQLATEFSEIDYVYTEKEENRLMLMSLRRGRLGEIRRRDDFIKLLRGSKICLVSAPGIDGDDERTGGFSPVTPRFLESAASGCRLIGIYPDNEDFNYFGIGEVCTAVDDYASFKLAVKRDLADTFPANHLRFVSKHTTSERAKELMAKLEKYER